MGNPIEPITGPELQQASLMKQAIVAFHLDEEGHWVADLACGHGQHVRHNPPWQLREWVIDEVTRAKQCGKLLNCNKCDRQESPDNE